MAIHPSFSGFISQTVMPQCYLIHNISQCEYSESRRCHPLIYAVHNDHHSGMFPKFY